MSVGFFILVFTIIGFILTTYLELGSLKHEKGINKVIKALLLFIAICSIPANIWDYTQSIIESETQSKKIHDLNSEITQQKNLLKIVQDRNKELEKRSAILEKLSNNLEKRIHLIDTTIASMKIFFSITFELPNYNGTGYENGLLISPDVIYASMGQAHFRSHGLTFAFRPIDSKKVEFLCFAEVLQGGIPLGKNFKDLTIFNDIFLSVPLLRLNKMTLTQNEGLFLVHEYNFEISINEKSVLKKSIKKEVYGTVNPFYNDDSVLWVILKHQFDKNLYNEIHANNKKKNK